MSDIPERLTAALADRYRIDRELGEGGMATVYLAEDLKHSRKVAIKVLKPELAAVVGAERFLSEIRTTANLQHPHILPLFDSGEADGFLYYVMPYMEGETLRDRISREKQLPVDEAVDIARKVASALDAAHRHGVIHRDIKPANILLQDGEPQVADFGIALAVQTAGGGRLTETGLSLGTPFYMSPEQATGDRDPDPRSDLYSLGCVTFEMLTGDPPFTGSTAQSVLAKILTDEAPVVTRVRKTVPANVASAVAKATQRLPADRFASAGEFAEALADPGYRYGGIGVVEGGMGGGQRGPGGNDGGGSPTLWKVASGILAVAALGLGVLAFSSGSADADREPLVLRVALPDSQALTYRADVVSTSLSDDGRTLVYVGPSTEGRARLWVKRRQERLPTPIPGTDGVAVFDVSPDGAEVAYTTAGSQQLRILPTAGGTPRTLVEQVQNRGMHWGADGYIYFQDLRSGISRVSTDTGETEPVVDRVQGADSVPELTWPWLLPGGDQLIVSRWGNTAASDSVAVVEIATGEQTVLARGNSAQFISPSHILIGTNDGLLVVQEYDPASRTLVGSPRSVADDVRSLGTAAVDFYAGADGTLLYAAGAGNSSSPAWVDRNGESTLLRDDWEGAFADLALSPDGSRMATSRLAGDRADIWVLDMAGNSPPQRITFDQPGINRPSWNPRGDTVLYLGGRSETDSEVLVQATQWNGVGRPRTVLAGPQVGATSLLNEALISRDGRYLVYRLGAGDSQRDIFALELNGDGDPREIAASPASESSPALSTDSRYIAYVSNESGRPEIYVRTFPDVSGGKWIVSSAGGSEPAWSDDGRFLYYRDARGQMMEVAWAADEDGGVLGRTELFDANRFFNSEYHTLYAVHPDGRFLMLESATDEQIGLIWVSNFSATLAGGD